MNQVFFIKSGIFKNANIFKILFCIDIVGAGRDLFSFNLTIIYTE